ncbi:MAG TPA: beta-propeller fold lactonase family protein [Candidatus Angelobacter sp.]
MVCSILSGFLLAQTSSQPEVLPTGMSITPAAVRGSSFQALNPDLKTLPAFTADHPVTTAVSPDGATLLILTSGFNRNNDAAGNESMPESNEYVFIYDISQQPPVKKQVVQIPNTFMGIAWAPDGKRFYVSGGSNDNIHIFEQARGRWTEADKPIALGHATGLGLKNREEAAAPAPNFFGHPAVAGIAVNASGTRLLAVNYENDSVSLVDLKKRKKAGELDLRPGKIDPTQKGAAGGEYPFWAVFKGNDKGYVSSLRDREIVVLDFRDGFKVTGRIKIHGQPNKLILNKAQTLLFAAADNSDSVYIIDTSSNRVIAAIKTTAPSEVFTNKGTYKGSNPNSLALSPDEKTLYVTNGGTNSVAVIALARDLDDSRVIGLIPTGWYPNSVSLNRDGSMLYVVNGKGAPGPNPSGCRNSLEVKQTCRSTNQYIWQLSKGGFLALPVPAAPELKELTALVARNNHFLPGEAVAPVPPIFSFLRSKIKHVIYVVKENRSYDQVLGDLERGNGDPALALFKEPIAPNHHQLARQFVVLDNFYDSGEVSGNGWNWSTAARATDNVEKTIAVNYAKRGFNYDYENSNRNINMGADTRKKREAMNPAMASLEDAEDQLPGTADVAAPDGPEDESGAGYLWDSALRAGLTVRNYGFLCDLTRYAEPDGSPLAVSLAHDPAATKTRVAFPANARLQELTDSYFRGFDQRFPDYWRYKEWEREFNGYVENNNLPALELVRISHDHFGKFKEAVDGVNTVETEMADNDYAVGLLVDKIAHSKYGADTLIFVIEDDAQNGPDHVDAHRSIALVAGPYVKQGAVIPTRYNTVSLLRTIEEVLGIKPVGLNDAVQGPMTEVFSSDIAQWNYQARVPAALRTTQLPVPAASPGSSPPRYQLKHDAEYWAQQTEGLDFNVEDRLDSERFNLVLWKGMMGDKPYPGERDGRDLRENREELLRISAANERE